MKARVLTAAIGIPIVLCCILARSVSPIAMLLVICSVICGGELARMLRRQGFEAIICSGLAYLLIAVVAGGMEQARDGLDLRWVLAALAALSCVGVWAVIRRLRGRPIFQTLALEGLWLGPPFAALVLLQSHSTHGLGQAFALNLSLMAILPLWVGDSLAYFVGRWIGKHPLCPTISPKKTWEGAIANLAGCIGAASSLGVGLGLEWWRSLMAGVALGVLGQAGDLLESALKRSVNVKDSGGILPGHGGLLDRVDSLLLPTVFVAIALLWA